MSDEEPRHPLVQSMIDVIEEVLEPEKYRARKAQQTKIAPPIKILELDPHTAMMLQLLQLGIHPKELFPDIDVPDEEEKE